MRGTPRRTRAAAPAATRRTPRSSSTREAFEDAGALDRLEGFASRFGADFYGLPRNADTVTLVREPWTVPAEYPFGDDTHRAAARGRKRRWRWRVRRAGLAGTIGVSYARSEASQTVAAPMRTRAEERKVRAPQSRMPGNARPL